MPSQKVKDVLRAFRHHFQQDAVDIPLALRQESPDIVYLSLLDDPDPVERMTPMLGFDPSGETMPMPRGGDPVAELQGLLGAAGLPTEALDQAQPPGGAPVPSGAAPTPSAPPAEEPEAGPDISAMLQGMI